MYCGRVRDHGEEVSSFCFIDRKLTNIQDDVSWTLFLVFSYLISPPTWGRDLKEIFQKYIVIRRKRHKFRIYQFVQQNESNKHRLECC